MRDRVVQRLAEYNAGVTEAAAQATFTDATIYARISTAIRDAVDMIARIDPMKIAKLSTFTYAANSESVTLAAALKYRPIVGVERSLSTSPVRYERLDPLTRWQDETRDGYDYDDRDVPYGFRIERDLIYVIPTPTQDLTLRARYVEDFTELSSTTDQANTLDIIPGEHHEMIAVAAALSFLRETNARASLEVDLAERRISFAKWAASQPKQGPRFVHERF